MPERRVLVVEDEAIVAMDIAATLERHGYAIAGVVPSGHAAVEMAAAQRPDLVLMDIHLRGAMNGIEAARAIREQLALPVVFLTAHADAETTLRASHSAPYGYVLKPFDEQELLRAVIMALQRHGTEHDTLWDSEERFRMLVEAVEDYAIVLLDLDGRIVSWNRGAERLSGYREEEVVGQSFVLFYPQEERDPERLRHELADVVASGRREVEGWRLRKNGQRYWGRSVRTPIIDRDGRARGVASVTHDVTERRALEAQLLEAQKLDSLGKLAGGVAHDFNNMLMVILTRAELLTRGPTLSDVQRRYLNDIITAARKSGSLTNQLLAAARQQVLQPEVVDLNEVVQSTMRLLASSLGEDVTLRLHLAERVWCIYADPAKLHQVLLNLSINAREAMPDGGTLAIETRNFRADAAHQRQHPALAQGDYVQLIVSDTGVGIPEEIRTQIYDPFFSTKARGSGLGLAVVRGIVEQTGGHIWLYSELGQGTTFRILFPRHDRAPAPAEAPQQHAEDETMLPARGHETILVVEDEALVRTILVETLLEHGYRVLQAATSAEALAVSRATPGEIDLLLTDMLLPGRNGRLLSRALVAERPHLRVIYMSGYTDDIMETRLEEGVRFLEKPVPTTLLLQTVRAALDE
jgi:two-component system, cell cycle sensor histidine kinase and response regulator CckA